MDVLDSIIWIITMAAFVAVFSFFFYKYGYKASYFVPLTAFIPPLLVAPFAYSAKNLRAVDETHLPLVWSSYSLALKLYCFSGLFFLSGIVIGSKLFRNPFYLLFDQITLRLLRTLGVWRYSYILFAVEIIIFIFLLSKGLEFGRGISLSFENTSIRPILSLWVTLNSFLVIVCAINFFCRRGLAQGILFIMVFGLSFATGQRGESTLRLFTIFLIYASASNWRSLIFPVLMTGVLIPIAFLQSVFRAEGQASASDQAQGSMIDEFLYGNQFSDIRDFAWILSRFDGHFLHGKTYLAGYTPFIPSFLSDFRQRWGWGHWSTETAGLDPLFHGGLRGGLFSEAYFNFGPLFMMLTAVLAGVLFGTLIAWEGYRASSLKTFRERLFVGFSSSVTSLIISSTVFTPGFYEALISIIIIVVS